MSFSEIWRMSGCFFVVALVLRDHWTRVALFKKALQLHHEVMRRFISFEENCMEMQGSIVNIVQVMRC
jgi:hypothetical protein